MPSPHFTVEFLLWCELLMHFWVFLRGGSIFQQGDKVDIIRTIGPTPGEEPEVSRDNDTLGSLQE